MIAGKHRDIAISLRLLVFRQIILEEAPYIAAGTAPEIAVVTAFGLIVAQQRIVAVIVMIQIEIHVKTSLVNGGGRIGPFADHRRLRIILVQHPANVPPDCGGGAFAFIVVFDQRISHVHTESVAALIQPEAHNVFHGFSGRECFR